MFPGDGDADDPAEVWNCRCTMRDHIVGFMDANGDVHYIDYERDKTLRDREIEGEKERRSEQRQVVNGKELTDIWERRESLYDFEIDDILIMAMDL